MASELIEPSSTVREREAQGLRILIIATHIAVPGTHGGTTHVSELLAHLAERAPTLLLARHGSKGRNVVPVGMLKGHPPFGLAHVISGVNLARSLSQVRQFAPNVIYERGSSFGLGAYYSKLLKIPMLTMLLDQHVSGLSLRCASKVITTNVELVPKSYRHKAVKVSWGANTHAFHPGVSGEMIRERYQLQGSLVVAYSGSFQKWHGLEVLLDAASQLPDELVARDLKFLLVGDGPPAAALKTEVIARGLSSRFVFTGALPYAEMPGALAAADICVAPFDPSKHSPSAGSGYQLDPLKLFEYLALRKPVVTLRAKNIERLFTDEQDLLLVPPGDPKALNSALTRLASDPAFAQKLAASGEAKVRLNHTWAAHADHLVQLFHEMRELGHPHIGT